MNAQLDRQSKVLATTTEVMPAMGLAYLEDQVGRGWTVTRQNAGAVFEHLRPGLACELTISHHRRCQFVSHCALVSHDD